jgi:hypothetical protein
MQKLEEKDTIEAQKYTVFCKLFFEMIMKSLKCYSTISTKVYTKTQ